MTDEHLNTMESHSPHSSGTALIEPPRHVAFGVEELDRAFGGVPGGEMTLVSGGPDTGKTVLGFNFLLAGLLAGERAVMVTSDEPEEMLLHADHLELPLRDYFNTDHFILVHQKNQTSNSIHDQQGLAVMLERLEEELIPWEPTRLVIDSGVPLIGLFAQEFRRNGLATFIRRLHKLGVTTFFTTRMPASSEAMMLRKAMEDLSGCSLHLDEQRRPDGETVRRMVFRKLKGLKPPYPVYNFEIQPQKGVLIVDLTETPLQSPKEEVQLHHHVKRPSSPAVAEPKNAPRKSLRFSEHHTLNPTTDRPREAGKTTASEPKDSPAPDQAKPPANQNPSRPAPPSRHGGRSFRFSDNSPPEERKR